MVGLTACSETAGKRAERQSSAALGAKSDISYDADDESKFAEAEHSCPELVRWYEVNPGDSNLEIAKQFFAECDEIPPPVLSFEVRPWDSDRLFVVMLEDLNPSARAERLIPLGRSVCEGLDQGLTRADLNGVAADRGIGKADNRSLIESAVTTLCPKHQAVLSGTSLPDGRSSNAQAADQLEAGLAQRLPAVSVSRKLMIRRAKSTCRAVRSGRGSESPVFWLDLVPGYDNTVAAEVAGMAVGAFCPELVYQLKIPTPPPSTTPPTPTPTPTPSPAPPDVAGPPWPGVRLSQQVRNTFRQDVVMVQLRLNELGYGPLEADGHYGPMTEQAVRAFQSNWGLEVDGIVGPFTWDALFG